MANTLLRSNVFRAGVYLLLLTVLVWVGFSMASAHEQARSPGEKNLGVAVLAMMFVPVIAVLGLASLGCILVSFGIVVHHRLSSSKQRSARDSGP